MIHNANKRRKGLYILSHESFSRIYGPDERRDVAALLDIDASALSPEEIRHDPDMLHDAEIIMSGWGGPRMDAEFLSHAPNLKAVFYGAGTIKDIVTDAFWERDLIITSSWAANAVPVAEFTVASIVYALKGVWACVKGVRRERKFRIAERAAVQGVFGATIGIISLGMIGRLVCERLREFDVRMLAYDPFCTEAEAQSLGVTLVDLDEIFRTADVVSVHAPWLKETQGMITGRHIGAMKKNASFINTARGAVVRERELIEALVRRTDIHALLDVTYPEPPAPDSPLYEMPNVTLTPHIAGSLGAECRRMGRYAVEELEKYCSDKPLQWRITREQAAHLA